MKTLIVLIFLTLATRFVHGEDKLELLFLSIQDVTNKQETILDKMGEMQQMMTNVEDRLQDIYNKVEHMQDIQQKLQQIVNDTEAQQSIMGALRRDTSSVVTLLEKGGVDECSDGIHECGANTICINSFYSYTCSCLPGYEWNGPDCVDINECEKEIDDCGSNAECINTLGSFSCKCDPPFEFDEQKKCAFECKSPDKVIDGLGCVKVVNLHKTWSDMKEFCANQGYRLLQDFKQEHLRHIKDLFSFGGWIGVYGDKWIESNNSVPAELWAKSFPPNDCGIIGRRYSPDASFRVYQRECSYRTPGCCQFIF